MRPLATRSKDLRLAGWYIESLTRKEGFGGVRAPGLKFLHELQEQFWETLYPVLDEEWECGSSGGGAGGGSEYARGRAGGKVELGEGWFRLAALSGCARAGSRWRCEKRRKKQDTQGCDRPRQDDRGGTCRRRSTQRRRRTTRSREKALLAALEALDALDAFHEEKYGSDYPSFSKLKTSIEEVQRIVTTILNEKRKSDPDPVEVVPEEVPEGTGEEGAEGGEPGVEGEPGRFVASPTDGTGGSAGRR